MRDDYRNRNSDAVSDSDAGAWATAGAAAKIGSGGASSSGISYMARRAEFCTRSLRGPNRPSTPVLIAARVVLNDFSYGQSLGMGPKFSGLPP